MALARNESPVTGRIADFRLQRLIAVVNFHFYLDSPPKISNSPLIGFLNFVLTSWQFSLVFVQFIKADLIACNRSCSFYARGW